MRDAITNALRAATKALLQEAGESNAAPPEFALEKPRRASHGDFACNAALLLARRLKQPPREIAAQIIAKLGDAGGLVQQAEVAGPGFINLWLGAAPWQQVLARVLNEGANYGRANAGAGQRVMVEFLSANPTGPLSVGHGRQAVLGDCLANLLAARGYEVTREYYFNNGGRQMRVLGESVRARYLEQLGRAAAFPEDGYQGAYIGEMAAAIREREGAGWAEEAGDAGFRAEAEARMFESIRNTQKTLGLEFDVYTNENSFYQNGAVEATLSDLQNAGLVFESEGAVWFRATKFGLARDRVLKKSGGEPTYLLPDIAYHRAKLRRGFNLIINVQGADHRDQGPYVKAGLQALQLPAARVEFLFHEFVTLSSGGRAVKQSTRKGNFITADELLAQVGRDVFRYFMVERRAHSHLDFNMDLAKEKDWTKNPAYGLQYVHARACGVERQAAARGLAPAAAADAEAHAAQLVQPGETALLKLLGEWPEQVAAAAAARAPHQIAYALRALAAQFNSFYQAKERHEILGADAALTRARLALVKAVQQVMANGLALLGMRAPERM